MESLLELRRRQLREHMQSLVSEFDTLMKIEMGTNKPVFHSFEALEKRLNKFLIDKGEPPLLNLSSGKNPSTRARKRKGK